MADFLHFSQLPGLDPIRYNGFSQKHQASGVLKTSADFNKKGRES